MPSPASSRPATKRPNAGCTRRTQDGRTLGVVRAPHFDATTRPLAAGDELLVNDRRVKIVGKSETLPRFPPRPLLYTTFSNATRILLPERHRLTFVLATASPGIAPRELATRIHLRTGLRARASDDFKADTVRWYLSNSEDVGDIKFDGSHDSVQSERRTSENAWCSSSKGCRDEEIPTRLHQRMSAVLGIPPENSEDLQLLKYEKGQFYRTHNDYIPHQADRQCGPRILTFFLYLSNVEAGGGTNFPQLDITVEARPLGTEPTRMIPAPISGGNPESLARP